MGNRAGYVKAGASMSFTEAELTGLGLLLQTLARGGDARLVARSAAVTNVHRKVLRMKDRAESAAAARAIVHLGPEPTEAVIDGL